MGKIEEGIGIHYPHQGHIPEVQPLTEHLGPYKDVDFARLKL